MSERHLRMTTQPPKPCDTRPSPALHQTRASATQRVPLAGSSGTPPPSSSGWREIALRLLPFVAVLALLFLISLLFGANSGQRTFGRTATAEARVYLDEQYALALQDIENGNLELARQRFEYIFTHDQSYTAAADRWVELSLVLNATMTVTPQAEPSVTPTPDNRPNEELFTQALVHIANRQWDAALQALASLRNNDAQYRVVDVDGLIYLSLRNRGLERILQGGQLESGIYDFSLAENFGPLDTQAQVARGWARLYLQGNAFWIAYPDIAAGYYGQVAAVAPNLMDESGMSAFFRYWSSLVQVADNLAAAEDWCAANDQYQAALAAANNANVAATAQAALQNCVALTPSLTPTITLTVPGPTATLAPATATGTETATLPAGATATASATATATSPAAATATPTPTATNPPPATATATPSATSEPPPTAEPTATPDGG